MKKIFKTYKEAMKKFFPNVWKKENKKTKTMKEIATDIMKKF